MKGAQVSNFKVGQHIQFHTDVGTKTYKTVKDTKGRQSHVFSHNVRVKRTDTGRIVKLHKSCRAGVAEIRPDHTMPDGTRKKLARRLQHVEAIKHVEKAVR